MTEEYRPSRVWQLSDLRAANTRRQAEWCSNGVYPDLSYRSNELAGECGEACNEAKKIERERHGWAGSRTTLEKLGAELADVVICADLVALTAGIDLQAAVVQKFNATSREIGLKTRLGSPDVAEEPAAQEVWVNRCPYNHARTSTCPSCEKTRPPGARHGEPLPTAKLAEEKYTITGNGPTPRPLDVWRHRNGTEYVVMFLTNVGESPHGEHPVEVVYRKRGDLESRRSRTLELWSRTMTYVGHLND